MDVMVCDSTEFSFKIKFVRGRHGSLEASIASASCWPPSEK